MEIRLTWAKLFYDMIIFPIWPEKRRTCIWTT